MASQKPISITTYDTIIIPFDKYVWVFTICSIIAEFILLIAMQNVWSFMTGTNNPDDFIFEGGFFPFFDRLNNKYEQISDICISTELISKGVLNRWIQRPGFEVRKVLIHKWIILGTLLHIAYESTLLSSLVPIRYEDTIDSITDLDSSGLPLMLWKGGSLQKHISADTRPPMRRIYNRSILVSLDKDGMPKWAIEM